MMLEAFASGCDAGKDEDAMTSDADAGPADGCSASGGTVTTSHCCASVADFPNTCAIGACGCALAASHNVKACECPDGECFDGEHCVAR